MKKTTEKIVSVLLTVVMSFSLIADTGLLNGLALLTSNKEIEEVNAEASTTTAVATKKLPETTKTPEPIKTTEPTPVLTPEPTYQ